MSSHGIVKLVLSTLMNVTVSSVNSIGWISKQANHPQNNLFNSASVSSHGIIKLGIYNKHHR